MIQVSEVAENTSFSASIILYNSSLKRLFISFYLKLSWRGVTGNTPEASSPTFTLQHPVHKNTHTACVFVLKSLKTKKKSLLYFLVISQLQHLFFLYSSVLWCLKNCMHKSQQVSVFFGVCVCVCVCVYFRKSQTFSIPTHHFYKKILKARQAAV